MTSEQYLVLVSSFIPFGPQRLGLLLKYFTTPGRVWEASTCELLNTGLKGKMVEDFDAYRKGVNVAEYFRRLKKLGISFVTKFSKSYPANLRGLDDAPYTLYIKGKLLKRDVRAVAVVGTRRITGYGREVAEIFSSGLARNGVTVVSGLARGVDTMAHKSALKAGGRTIAVLGSGLDYVYPPENIGLVSDIIRSGGAVASEFPLGYPVSGVNFITRNRIISGLSKAVLVVEGEVKSGTLITASHAANQGKDVFAVCGQITSPMSGAPHFLIKNGAKIAFEVGDILSSLDEVARISDRSQ